MAGNNISTNLPSAPLGIDPRDLEAVLQRTADCWTEMRGARLFISGGTGFFGKWLLASILWANARLDAGVEAVVLSREPNAFLRRYPDIADKASIKLWPGDVASFEVPDGSFSHVIHAATDTKPTAHHLHKQNLSTIVDGTTRMLDFAGTAGADSFLLTSSGAIYGEQPGELERTPESYSGAPDPLDMNSVYGSGKRYAETLCAVAAREGRLRPKIARCYAFVGPHLTLDGHFAIGNFILDSLTKPSIQVKGDGRAVRSYLYAADLTVWLWTILLKGQPGRAYNVGSDQFLSIRELAETVVETLTPGKEINVQLKSEDIGKRSRYVPSIDRARSELGLDVWTPLPDAIRKTAAWYLASSSS